MKINLIKLKIKAKSLAEEAKIIRKEEQKLLEKARAKGDPITKTGFWIIRDHRVWNVRNEARATQLAIAFIKGHVYNRVERNVKDKILRDYHILPRVVIMVAKYGKNYGSKFDRRHPDYQKIKAEIEEWMSEQS